MPVLTTIGYQNATPMTLADALRFAGVELLIDVRAVAASRRPGFSKRQLAAGLSEAGIGYIHLRGLGTPAEGRAAARAGRTDALRRIYLDHLATPAARAELNELSEIVRRGRRVCLLCFEHEPERCHRMLVAEAVAAETGAAVNHLRP